MVYIALFNDTSEALVISRESIKNSDGFVIFTDSEPHRIRPYHKITITDNDYNYRLSENEAPEAQIQ